MLTRGFVVRFLSLAAVLGMVVSGLSAAVPSGPDRPAAPRIVPVAEALDVASAVRAANLQGSRVAIVAERSPTREVFANPGGSMTAELTAVPTRVQRGGSWVAVDTSMVSRPDGLVGPRAAVGDLSLSGGGSKDALARLVKDGRSVALRWPGTLPTPKLEGATATYPEVFPGVDLVMVATRSGLRQHVVVKSAEAARNPALARIVLRVESPGLRLSVDELGVLRAVDAAGVPVFEAPPPEMWDSSGRTAGPATARSARVGVVVTDGSLTLVPDQRFLRDPAVVFPVTVDPAWAPFDKNAWATVLDGKPDSSYWWTSGEDPWAQVGQCYRGNPDRCNRIGAARAYFQYDTGFLNGKDVLEAALNTTAVHSPSCGERVHAVWWADGGISPGTTWNNQPGGWWISDSTAPVVYDNGDCGGWKAVGFNVGGNINRSGISTYRLNAANEGDMLAWRKYNPADTKLVVRYNQPPYAPDQLRTDPPLPAPCRWCDGRPYIGDASIRLIARLSDPDGDNVRPKWRINDGASTAAWDGGYQASGATHDTPVNVQDGREYGWWVHADDGTVASGPIAGPGPWVVDQVGIPQRPKVTGSLYLQDNRWHGGVGVPGTFTFERADDINNPNYATDIDHYLWGTSDPPTHSVNAEGALGGPATITFTPTRDGPQDLFVQSVDRAGHRSPTKVYHFYVRAGNGPLAQWSFEGNADDTAFLGDRHGTLNGNVTFGPGATGAAAQFDGRPGTDITAPYTVRTDASFSVMAWVKLTDASVTGARAVVSQDGTNFAGLNLWYRQDRGGKWVFGTQESDTRDQYDHNWAESSQPGHAGVWTHLAGVYDAPNGQLRLYVNGVLSGTAPRAVASWNATGLFRIGQTIWNGYRNIDPWPGLIDEVAVYDRVVSQAEVRSVVGRDNVQAAYWRFDEAADATGTDFGTTARNDVEGGGMGVLTNGATFTRQGAVKGAVQLDGVDDQVVTGGPAVRTDQSFSVAAWVRAERFVPGGASMTAVSQDGNRNSGFYLQYDSGIQKWVFKRPTTDDDSPSWSDVSASQQPVTGQWVHLAGTFDAATRQLQIFVNGELGGTGTLPNAPWNATGPMAIGRAKLGGNPVHFWPGAIDEVRVYSRVLSAEEIRGIVSQNNVTVGLWKLDGTASDDSGQGHHGTLLGGPAWAPGQGTFPGFGDMALQLDGVDDCMQAVSPVDTVQSFSVSVWAKVDQLGVGGKRAVVSQDGNRVSAFKLRSTADGRWSFAMYGSDVDGGGSLSEVVGAAVQVGVWTHLAAVYSRERQRLELYVNGVLFGSAARTGGFTAGGTLAIGRAKWNGNVSEFFPGAIDDVAVYNRPLFAEEIRTMAGRDLSLVHNWRLDESGGANAADAVGGRAGTLSGGAGFVPGRAANGVRLDGVDDVVSTTGVDLRTDQSFTVTTWVYLNGNDCDLGAVERCVRAAVTVDGTRTSKFRLGHMVDSVTAFEGNWIFEMPESDTDDAPATAALSVLPGELNTWVHLTGVYDAQTKKIWLYVNGNRVADGTLNNPWQATGGVRIGRGKVNGAATEFWSGQVDDVRLYTGVLSKDRVSALVVSYGTQPGSLTLPVADAGYWKFDEGSGTTAADSSGRGLTATLRGGVGWRYSRNAAGAVFDGVSGYAETAGAVLNTSQSFSVAAWVYPSGQSSGTRAVAGQDGAQVSAFTVGYRAGDSRFVVRAPTVDQSNPGSVLLASAEPVVAGHWSHVTVVYHREIGWLCLYVNGALSAIQNGVTVLGSNGPLSLGRSRWNGANAEFFNGVIDDVRVYQSGLWDGEVRTIHDDVHLARQGYWRFDGTSADASGRNNQTTVSGGASYTQGVNGQALQVDGVSGAATTQYWGVPMTDSFTVSAWAKLTSTDRVQTVLGQDGARMSGFALQYRPELNRWVFAARTQDTDSAALLYAAAPQPPTLNTWTHLTGIYDYPGRQLRLYVDGQLAGTRDNVRLWPAWNGFTMGRGKFNGAPAEFFAGAIDEAITDMGAASEAEVLRRVSYAPPSGGQLVRFVNAAGDHYTANSTGSFWNAFTPVPPGYRVDRSLGRLLSSQQSNTQLLYACLDGTDEFTSPDPACEGKPKLADLGWAYTEQPTSPPTVPLYRCRAGADHFDSVQSTCETTGAVNEMLLGYTVGYAPLTWYYNRTDWEMRASTFGAPVGYEIMATLGVISLTAQPGTQQLWSCLDGADGFVSVDAGCDGTTVVASLGWIWAQPPDGAVTSPLYRCILSTGDRFMDRSANCAGATVDRQLGYVLDWLSGGNPAMAAGDGPPPPVTLPPEVLNPMPQPF